LHLLFWLSLIPFITGWIGENNFAKFPMMLYGIILLMCGFSYSVLQTQIIKLEGKDSILSKAIGNAMKEKASIVFYCVAIGFANFYPMISGVFYIIVALMWLVPDKRIENIFKNQNK
jgi:uncharacterized membrane protein